MKTSNVLCCAESTVWQQHSWECSSLHHSWSVRLAVGRLLGWLRIQCVNHVFALTLTL